MGSGSTAHPIACASAARRSNIRLGPSRRGWEPTHFLTKTLEKVRTEMSLQVLAYNLKRMIAIAAAHGGDEEP